MALPWQPGANRAVCARDVRHAPPVADCMCGLYALTDPADRRLDFRADQAVGAIAAWGDLEVHRSGFRAEHACVTALALPDRAGFEQREALARAAERYGVPLVAADRLSDEALRHGAPLPDDLWAPSPSWPPPRRAGARDPRALPPRPVGRPRRVRHGRPRHRARRAPVGRDGARRRRGRPHRRAGAGPRRRPHAHAARARRGAGGRRPRRDRQHGGRHVRRLGAGRRLGPGGQPAAGRRSRPARARPRGRRLAAAPGPARLGARCARGHLGRGGEPPLRRDRGPRRRARRRLCRRPPGAAARAAARALGRRRARAPARRARGAALRRCRGRDGRARRSRARRAGDRRGAARPPRPHRPRRALRAARARRRAAARPPRRAGPAAAARSPPPAVDLELSCSGEDAYRWFIGKLDPASALRCGDLRSSAGPGPTLRALAVLKHLRIPAWDPAPIWAR